MRRGPMSEDFVEPNKQVMNVVLHDKGDVGCTKVVTICLFVRARAEMEKMRSRYHINRATGQANQANGLWGMKRKTEIRIVRMPPDP